MTPRLVLSLVLAMSHKNAPHATTPKNNSTTNSEGIALQQGRHLREKWRALRYQPPRNT